MVVNINKRLQYNLVMVTRDCLEVLL